MDRITVIYHYRDEKRPQYPAMCEPFWDYSRAKEVAQYAVDNAERTGIYYAEILQGEHEETIGDIRDLERG